MLFFKKNKDGGKDSNTTAYWLCEIKPLFSIGLLKFEGKSREVYHNHAFDCIGLVLLGKLTEERIDKPIRIFNINSGFFPIYKNEFHKVSSDDITWVFTIRGPWNKIWNELHKNFKLTLTNGRKEINKDYTKGYNK